ncbi:MAG: xylulokinase [Acidobacteriia bacterium]|nr:xylulokinase [Terriglobia bacterium]
MKFLGIDVGTGGTRALIIDGDEHKDEHGRVVASGTEEHVPFASPQLGWAEQNPNDWWRACGLAVRRALDASGTRGDEIACVGFSGQMHGAVLLDAHDEVVRPALIWCDQRTEPQVRELTDLFGTDRLIQLTCNPPLTNFTLTKLLWVRENEPRNWERVSHVMLPKDYVRFQLTGERAIDMADASGTLLLDVAKRQWSSEVLSRTGIDQQLLPALWESPEVCGRVSARGGEATGLSAGTPVVAGAGDQAAGAVGMGIVRPGTVSATIGTSGVVFAATGVPALDPKGGIHTFCHAIPGRWHVMGVTQAAGLSLRWFRDRFGAGAAASNSDSDSTDGRNGNDGGDLYARLCEEAATAPPGCDGVFWAPYLMGERTPHCDPHARAALVGLTATHTRAHVIRAILEGVAFSLRDTFTIFGELNVPVERIRLGGGGARSPLWRQIQADVYGQAVEVVQTEEGAAYGAAILAGVGAGNWRSVDEACDAVVHTAHRIQPDPKNSAILNEAYRTYRRIYPALRQISNRVSAESGAQPAAVSVS